MFRNTARVVQLGPAKSGVTSALGGLQLALEEIRGGDVQTTRRVSQIRNRLLTGEFPPPALKTLDALRWLETGYTTGLLSRTTTLQTLDYPGALLQDVLAPVRDDVNITLTERASNWKQAKQRVQNIDEEVDRGTPQAGIVASAIWDCVRHADTLLCTVPLDDFLGPIIARGNEPAYIDVVRGDDYDTETELKEALGLTEGQNIPEASTFEHDGETFYTSRAAQRTAPEEYLDWYSRLRMDSRFTDTDFAYIATKADYAIPDFRGDAAVTPLADYEAFRDHVARDVLFEASKLLERDCRAENIDIWPVWYDVTVDGRTWTIDLDGPEPTLRGSRQVLERLGL